MYISSQCSKFECAWNRAFFLSLFQSLECHQKITQPARTHREALQADGADVEAHGRVGGAHVVLQARVVEVQVLRVVGVGVVIRVKWLMNVVLTLLNLLL